MNKREDVSDRPENIGKNTSGFFFVLIGVLLLLNTLGILPWSMWGSIWNLWPVVIIFIGLQLISGKSILKDFIMITFGFIIVIGLVSVILYRFVPDFRNIASDYIPDKYLEYID